MCYVVRSSMRSWLLVSAQGVSAPPSGVAVGRGEVFKIKYGLGQEYALCHTDHCNIFCSHGHVVCTTQLRSGVSSMCVCPVKLSVRVLISNNASRDHVLGADVFFAASTSFPASYTGTVLYR